jgi:hypothetical protein
LNSLKEITPWKELLEKKTFSSTTLASLPLSYQTTDDWFNIILESAGVTEEMHTRSKLKDIKKTASNLTWLHALHIGVNFAERGVVDIPIQYFKSSVELFPNPIAYRCLAVLSSSYEVNINIIFHSPFVLSYHNKYLSFYFDL